MKILLISHSAERTGAPLMLLNTLRWLNAHSDVACEVLLREQGSLLKEFETLATTRLAHPLPEPPPGFFLRNARKRGLALYPEERHRRDLLAHYRDTGIDLIYSNTIINGDILEQLSPLGLPVITHVHELGYWIERSGGRNLELVLAHTQQFICASQAVSDYLSSRCGVGLERIAVIHSMVPTNPAKAAPAGIRQQLGIPEQAFLVIGAGHENWRKGKDLFVQLASLVTQEELDRPVHFLWAGGWGTPEDRHNIMHDVRHLGLEGSLHFVGEIGNPEDYFAAADVLALTSREDSFPLVCLEAAAQSKPIVCFGDAGGAPEFVESDAGFVLPYLDLAGMSKALARLATDSELKRRLGERAANKVRERHDIRVGAAQIERIIHEFARDQPFAASKIGSDHRP